MLLSFARFRRHGYGQGGSVNADDDDSSRPAALGVRVASRTIHAAQEKD